MRIILRLLRWGFGLLLTFLFIIVVVSTVAFLKINGELPDVADLKTIQYHVPMRVLAADGRLIGEFGEKRREPLPIEDIPTAIKQAVIAAEDARYYKHPGVDYKGLIRAAWSLITTGTKAQGGSTITMQVARNFYLTRERTYNRKIREILLALKIERELDKEEILALYLNQNFMGNRAYGVAAAAITYYGKPLQELDLAQIAMLAGLYKAPSKFNPIVNPTRAETRRNYVLRRMSQDGYIDVAAKDAAIAQPLTASIHITKPEVEATYVAEMVRNRMFSQFDDATYTSGFTVYTTLNGDMQIAADTAIKNNLLAYTLRHGYRGPEDQIKLPESFAADQAVALLAKHPVYSDLIPALVVVSDKSTAELILKTSEKIKLDLETVNWAKTFIDQDTLGAKVKRVNDILKPGDIVRVKQSDTGWQLSQLPKVGGALVSISPQDGRIYALSGGFNFYLSRFNRAIQAVRQPGSNFKPFIYSAAIANGFTPASTFNDAPVVFHDLNLGRYWRPENYSGKFYGPTRLRLALAKSRNMISIRVLRRVGIKDTIAHIKKLKMTERPLPHDLSLSLGSSAMTPLELVSGYATFANGGFRVKPWFIQQVRDMQGNIIYQHIPEVVCGIECDLYTNNPDEVQNGKLLGKPAERVLEEHNAYQITSMLQDVIRMGTGTRANKLKRPELAGKTGTTNDQIDAWFSGYSHDLATTVWVGFDEPKPLGRKEVGGRLALPIWIDYMRVALEFFPEKEWHMPEEMVTVTINKTTGQQAEEDAPNTMLETFRINHVPEMGATEIITEEGISAPEQIF